jgi:hypothetical protein|uniref:Cyclin N-terminal domain-containing protein n=1 Tax=Attheya septentrionalis TaxID=420275 RepID=A0A7S2U530_9STRA|mmetsp:Transcript_10894/g.19913  ORF Transcript_10894/g.19913 Transcript_10894/m.19913 type:complete len:345 (+) Transcript_10894:193-1227(+)
MTNLISPIMCSDYPLINDDKEYKPVEMNKNELVRDQLCAMLSQEESVYPCLSSVLLKANTVYGSEASKISALTETWRRKICEWSFDVVDHFGFEREVVSISFSYFDRFVALHPSILISQKQYQLVAVTSLYLATKLHGELDKSTRESLTEASQRNVQGKLRLSTFVEISRGLASSRSIEEMERAILHDLSWRLNPPTSASFLSRFHQLIPNISSNEVVITALFEMSAYLTELSICFSAISCNYSPSVIAYASLLEAMETIDIVNLPVKDRLHFVSQVAIFNRDLKPDATGVIKVREALYELSRETVDVEEITKTTLNQYPQECHIVSSPSNVTSTLHFSSLQEV